MESTVLLGQKQIGYYSGKNSSRLFFQFSFVVSLSRGLTSLWFSLHGGQRVQHHPN